MKVVNLLIACSAFFSCSDSLTNYYEVSLDKEFSLRVGESVNISQHGVVVKFKTIEEDSRCPSDYRCFWAGNAVVVLDLKNSNRNEQTTKLNTYLDPKVTKFLSLVIELKELVPYPKTFVPIKPEEYVAKLIVKKKVN